jgi:predicted CopG family antitoxin
MSTTVAVADNTYHRLATLKEEWHAASFDEVIRRLVDQAVDVPASMFGTAPKLGSLTKRERLAMWDEDEHVRQADRGTRRKK